MKHTSLLLFQMLSFCAMALAGTDTVCSAEPQSASPGKQTQKLANPLNDLLDEAQSDIDKSEFEAAIVPLQKFLAEKPDVAFAHSQLGYVFTALKRSEEARTEYERAVALDPKVPEAWVNLGLLLMEKDPVAAVKALRRAVEQLPTQSRTRFLLGVAQERAGDLTGAAESLEGASHLNPKDVDALLHLGSIYLRQKKSTDAEGKFRAVLATSPKQPAALRGLAQSLDALNKPEAADAFRAYLEVEPNDDGARARLMHFLIDKQEYDAALAELDKSGAGKPATVESLKLRADIQIAQKKYDDSIVTLRRAVELAPGDGQLHAGLGRIYLQKREFPNAEQELKTALRIDSNNATYWKDLSSAYYLEGNCPATLDTLDIVAKTETPSPAAWFIRALCYDKMDQVGPALEAYHKFLDLDQNKNPDQVWQAQQRSKILLKKQQRKR